MVAHLRIKKTVLPSLLGALLLGCVCLFSSVQAEESVELPLEVPYFSQLNNTYEPAATCSITSMAMVTEYLGITNSAAQGVSSPDFIYQKYGKLQTVDVFVKGFNELAEQANSPWRDNGTEAGTIAELRERAQNNLPSVVHGWFTSAGHILVVIGFDGEFYTVHDPYGRWNEKKWGGYDTAQSGRAIRYPREAFEFAINDNGEGNDLWLHRFENRTTPNE